MDEYRVKNIEYIALYRVTHSYTSLKKMESVNTVEDLLLEI